MRFLTHIIGMENCNVVNADDYTPGELQQIRIHELLDEKEQLEKKKQVLEIEKKELQDQVEKLEVQKDELERSKKCVICIRRERDTMFDPCGHFNFCRICATRHWELEQAQNRVVTCPICRKFATMIRTIYS